MLMNKIFNRIRFARVYAASIRYCTADRFSCQHTHPCIDTDDVCAVYHHASRARELLASGVLERRDKGAAVVQSDFTDTNNVGDDMPGLPDGYKFTGWMR